MNDLILPQAIGELLQPGVPFVAAIVEGVDPLNPALGWRSLDAAPPAWLVALRDARCRCVCHVVAPAQGVHCWDRCHDGRLLHDVRVEDPDGEHDGYTECRTVRCLVDVVEVNDLVAIGMSYELSPNVLAMGYPLGRPNVYGVPPTLIYDGKGYPLTPAHVDALAAACGKPPADWPGGYAVILEVK